MEFFSGGLYQFTFTWTIENISLCPQKPKQSMLSPSFVISVLGATKWRLVLLPRGLHDPAYLSLFLCRQEDKRIKQLTINFKFSIETTATLFRQCKVANDVQFEEGDLWGYTKYLRRDYLSMVLSGSTAKNLTLRCDIGASSGVITNFKWNETVDFQMLSNNLMTLFNKKYFADVSLCCDGYEIKVHRCILAVRLPKLLSELRFLNNGQLVTYCNVFNISLPVLKSLLFYAYSGKLDLTPSEVTLELLNAAFRYELPDVIQKLKSYPRFYYARTTYNVEQMSFAWNILKSTLCETNTVHLVRVIPTDALYVDSMTVCCSVQTDIQCEYVQRVLMTFQIPDLDEEFPIFVSCRIFICDRSDKLFGLCSTDRLIQTKGKWIVPVNTNKAPFRDVIELLCEIDLCDGENSTTIRNSRISCNESVIYFHDYNELQVNMSGLFSEKYHSDFSIVTEGQTFAVHSAILAARSPVFCKMLEHDMLERNCGEVLIRDASPEIVQLMLLYMYSGTVRDLEYDEAIDLYRVADKYCILVLKERCGNILVSKLNSCNVVQLYELADMHFDNIMRKLILERCKSEPHLQLKETEGVRV